MSFRIWLQVLILIPAWNGCFNNCNVWPDHWAGLILFVVTEHGYVTSYCEDSPHIGTFQYRLVGFDDPPTDYYPRAFFLAAHKKGFSRWNPHCYGSEKIHNYHLDLARKIYEQYPKRKKFLFHFPGIGRYSSNFTSNILDPEVLPTLSLF